MPTDRRSIEAALQAVADDFGGEAKPTILFENGRKHVREIQRIIAALPLNGTLLDVGGGLGVNVLAVRRLRPDTKLLLADGFVEYDSGNRMGSADRGLRLLEAAGVETIAIDFWPDLQLQIESGTVHVATSFDVIEHLPGPALQHLSEIRRTLRSDGVLILASPNAASLMKRVRQAFGAHPYIDFELWLKQPYHQHYREYTISEHTELLQRSGSWSNTFIAAMP
ncbi:MAG: methyltransferase domain-containing protein [Gemmatimonadota bacterium]